MRKAILIYLVIFVSFYGCTKDDDNNISAGNPPVNSQRAFSAVLDGVLFETDSVFAFFHIDSTMHIRSIYITGYIGDEYVYAMQVDTVISEYIDLANTPSGWGGPMIGYADTSGTFEYDSDTANMTFTAQDTLQNKISGTFDGFIIDAFTSDTIHLTNGRFTDVIYEFEAGN